MNSAFPHASIRQTTATRREFRVFSFTLSLPSSSREILELSFDSSKIHFLHRTCTTPRVTRNVDCTEKFKFNDRQCVMCNARGKKLQTRLGRFSSAAGRKILCAFFYDYWTLFYGHFSCARYCCCLLLEGLALWEHSETISVCVWRFLALMSE